MGFRALLRQRATLQVPVDTGSRDRLNRPIYRWDTVAEGVPVLRQQIAAQEITTATGDRVVVDWRIYLLPRPDVTERCRLVIDGLAYELGVPDDPGGRGHHLEALARRVG